MIGDNGWVAAGISGSPAGVAMNLVSNKVNNHVGGGEYFAMHPLTSPGDVIDFSLDVDNTTGAWGVLFAPDSINPTGPSSGGVLAINVGPGANNWLFY